MKLNRKMDATVNDFLNEINEIAPPKNIKHDSSWKECFDETSGYPYYWNVRTDEVTWEMPVDYKIWQGKNAKSISRKQTNLYIPPNTVPALPIITRTVPIVIDAVKIHKIQNEPEKKVSARSISPTISRTKYSTKMKNLSIKSLRQSSSDSDDEKIVLISSYGENTDSENDEHAVLPKTEDKEENLKILGPTLQIDATSRAVLSKDLHSNHNSDEDDKDLLTQIHCRAKLLKELGGELPPDVKNLIETDLSEKSTSPVPMSNTKETKNDKQEVTGFSLVAGYGNDSEDDDEITKLFPIPETDKNNVIGHSTLFPPSQPIDIQLFIEPEKEDNASSPDSTIYVKAFKRKRRIGIDLPNLPKKGKQEDLPNSPVENSLNVTEFKNKVEYSGFKSGGVMFLKGDIVNLSQCNDDDDVKQPELKPDVSQRDNGILQKQVDEIQATLKEKLSFLSEGREPVSAVQVLIIQVETLHTAMKSGGLTINYLQTWLNEKCAELIKLEEEAAPNGWLLQWDRLNKRYFYHNQYTGESQWDYPQPDIVGGDEAMDICTTPPPAPCEEAMTVRISPVEPVALPVTPPPPLISEKMPTPPPPPIITKRRKHPNKEIVMPLPPLENKPPPPPLSAENFCNVVEPLPPGVESPEVVQYIPSPAVVSQESVLTHNDHLGTALNSFYSDLAAIETKVPTTEVIQPSNTVVPTEISNVPQEIVKKKKKKVKLAPGLTMKKKGVSKLVEKWKNVQKSYD